MSMLKVSNVRKDNIQITKKPIIYYWWFKSRCLDELFKNFDIKDCKVKREKLKQLKVDCEDFALLYIGQGKNGNERLVKYHILDSNNFHLKGVQNGRLSSLRKTLCGLLNLPMSESKEKINRFMDAYCVIQWVEVKINDLESIEVDEIKIHYLPLNYKHTKEVLQKCHRKVLRESKKAMKR